MTDALIYQGIRLGLDAAVNLTNVMIQQGPWQQLDGSVMPEKAVLLDGTADGTIRTEEYPCYGLASVQACAVYASDCKLRVRSGGVSYYWTGAAWAVATIPTHVNTQAQVMTGMLAWTKKTFALEATLTKDLSPWFSGMRIIVARRPVTSSLDTYRASSPIGEFVYNALIQSLQSALVYWLHREQTQSAAVASISYASGFGESKRPVLDAVAFDLTVDPQCLAPLGTWNVGTKVLTFTPAIPIAHVRLDRVRLAVPIYFSGDADYETEYTPFLALKGLRRAEQYEGEPFSLLRTLDVYTAGPAKVRNYAIEAHLYAERVEDLSALQSAFEDALKATAFRSLESGQWVGVHLSEALTVRDDGRRQEAVGAIEVIGFEEWPNSLTISKQMRTMTLLDGTNTFVTGV